MGAVLETIFPHPKNEDDANYAKITDASWTQQVYENGKNTYHCNRRHIAASCLSVQVDF